MIAPSTLPTQTTCQCGPGCGADPDSGVTEMKTLARDLVMAREHAFHHRMDQVRELLARIVLRGDPMDTLEVAVAELIGRDVSIELDGSNPAGDPGTYAIEASGRCLGRIRVSTDPGPLDSEQDEIARQAAIWAAMLVLTTGTLDQPALTIAGTSAVGRGAPDDWVGTWLSSLALEPSRHHVAIALVIGPDEPGSDPEAAMGVANTAVERAMHGRRVAAFVASSCDELIIVVPVAGRGRATALSRTLVDHITSLVRLAGPRYSVSTGLTSLAEDVRSVPQRVAEARMAARIGRVIEGPDAVTSFRDLRALPAIVGAVAGPDDGSFRELHERYLGALVRYESRTGLPLVQTLTVLFDENGNVSGAARSLGLNRQSLLYRLRKIETMCEADLADPADRFALELAVRSWAVRQALFPTPEVSAAADTHDAPPVSIAARAARSGTHVGSPLRAAAG